MAKAFDKSGDFPYCDRDITKIVLHESGEVR